MQEKKEGTKPVRIKASLLKRLEALAIKESGKRGKLLTIAEIVDELLEKELREVNNQDAKDDK